MPDPVNTREESESHDEEYDENADEDFNPDAAVGADDDISASSEDEDGAQLAAKTAKKRKAATTDDVEEELDSGDEATIKERKRRRKKGKDKDDDEDCGGEGGLIKTRAQRLVEKAERRQRKRGERGEVTVDVDALWAELSTLPLGRPTIIIPKSHDHVDADDNKENDEIAPTTTPADQLIKIKRRIEFAGEVTEVEEEVLRSSAAAQRYLAEHPEADPDFKPDISANGLQRPLRRPSMFEPNPTAAVRGVPADKLRPRAPSRLDVLMAERRAADEKKKKAEKMSTVQKSALDWRGFVKDQGIGDELDEYGKSKKGFLAREQFLDRVAGANEAARREARLKG